MKVRCVTNAREDLPAEFFEQKRGPDVLFFKGDLVPGQEYVVYGFTVKLNHIWYYLCTLRGGSSIPFWYPSPLFEVTDPRLSRYWIYRYWLGKPRSNTNRAIFAFPEWANELAFYERLVDTDEDAARTFRKYKSLIDAEAEEEEDGSH